MRTSGARDHFRIFFLIAFALTFLDACSPQAKTPQDTLVIGIENEIKNLDLRFAADANSAHIATLVFQSLTRIGDDLRPELALASDLKVINDKEFRFTIPKGMTFHDGSPLSSQDILYNFKQASGPQSKVKSSFEDVESFEAPDDTSFVIRLKKPRPSFLASDISVIRIFPKHLGLSPEMGKTPIGSGPYRFIERNHRDLIFERFAGYQTHTPSLPSALPNFKKVIVRSIEDPTTRFFSIVGGDIDVLINALSPRRVFEASQEKSLQIIRGPGSTYQYIGLNLKNKKFQDQRVREALSVSIDRGSIINHKLKGFAAAASSLLSPQNYFFNSKIPIPAFDPVRALKLLSEAGVHGLDIEIRSSADRDVLSILQVIQEQWRQVGIKSHIRSTEFADFFSAVQKGQFEVFSLRWTAVSEPDLLNRVFHSKELPPGKNRTFYSNPVLDKILDQASMETNVENRRQLYLKVQEILAKDLPYISLWYPDNIAVASSELKNFSLGATGAWQHLLYAKKDPSHDR